MMASIYFDLDGTLITYSKGFKQLFELGLGFEVSKEVHNLWTEELLANIDEMVERPYLEAMKALEHEFDLGLDPEEATERYIEAELECTEVHEELLGVLKKLSENHKIGILTNGVDEVQRRKVEKHGIDKHVDEVIISNPEGVRKPDSEIFKLAKKRLKADKYIYIGDTFDEDIVPARENGFKTIYVSGEKEADLMAENPESLGRLLKILL
jgi:putative hydrolase of the HAD superfamily